MFPNLCLDVSRETQDLLEIYQALLTKWQARINLVASDTLPDSWNRHFFDSLQLVPFLPPGKIVLADIGTGAGFPGLVLAIARPDIQVHLVESDAKKCEFLKTVSRETSLCNVASAETEASISGDPGLRQDDGPCVSIHNTRIEKILPFPVDVMTARALAPLVELFKYALPYAVLSPDFKMIFLKGAQTQDEITAARHIYDFNVEMHNSLTSSSGRVLIISQLKRK